MMFFLSLLLGISFVLTLLSAYMLGRNEAVFQFRMRRLSEAQNCAKKMIDAGMLDWREPYLRLEDCTYDKMLYSVCPFNHFIPDNWLEDLYGKIDDARRTTSFRENNMVKGVLVEATGGNMEADQQGRPAGDAGCGKMEQG